jgi:hypothetical protein
MTLSPKQKTLQPLVSSKHCRRADGAVCCVVWSLQAAASSAVESLIDMQGCLVVIISNSRWVWCEK